MQEFKEKDEKNEITNIQYNKNVFESKLGKFILNYNKQI